MTEIKNKVNQFRLVEWRSLKWLQNENLKDIDLTAFEKLKNSLKKNNFIQPFNVWKDPKGKLWILDGSHRQRAMIELEKEGVKIPKTLPANFIQCKNKKEAAKLVLVYSSLYAKTTEVGVKEFLQLNNLLLSDIDSEIDLGLDLDLLIPENSFDDETPEVNTEAKDLSDVYVVVGEFRILVEREKYLSWLEELKHEVGFDNLSVLTEIKNRLQLP